MIAFSKVLRSWLGRNGFLAASILGILALVMSWDKSRVEAGRKIERAEQIEKGAELNAKGLAAHSRAERPGALQRLREKYCLDC